MSHPITPPPELVQQWMAEFYGAVVAPGEATTDIATRAAQWGADQELEACKQWLSLRGHAEPAIKLGYCMRNKPEPPSLKEQAQQALSRFDCNAHTAASEMGADFEVIRRALEALPDS